MDPGEAATQIITDKNDETKCKKVFVIGATGSTGKRIVEQLLSRGFEVKAGVRNVEKAKTTLSIDNPALQIVKADVTDSTEKLAEVIGDDTDAVISSVGARPGWNLTSPWKIEKLGTINLVEACRKQGVSRFVIISSLLVNGAAMGQVFNPVYILLNAFGLILVAKHQADQYIRQSGLDYTIIRPGGLKDDPPTGNVIMEPEDTLFKGAISRDQVAEVAVEALLHPESSNKVVEIVSSSDAPKRPYNDLFASVKQK